jgi:hypothetical protein
MKDSQSILQLELDLIKGGWSIETQRDILNWLKGVPRRFESPGSYAIDQEARGIRGNEE